MFEIVNNVLKTKKKIKKEISVSNKNPKILTDILVFVLFLKKFQKLHINLNDVKF